MKYVFQRGEDIAVPILAEGATPDDLADLVVTMALKQAWYRQAPPSDEPVVATFDVEPRDVLDGLDAPGFVLSIPAAVSATLAAGTYAANPHITVAGGGGTIIGDLLLIRIEEAT